MYNSFFYAPSVSLVALKTAQNRFSDSDRIEYRLYGLAPDGKKVPISIFTGGESSAADLIGEICGRKNTQAIGALVRALVECFEVDDWRAVNISYYDHPLKRVINSLRHSYDEYIEVRPVRRTSSAANAGNSNR